MTRVVNLPGYVAGTWRIDPAHSDVRFAVRHLMMSKIKGRFREVRGTVELADDPLDSTVDAEIDLDSVDTGNQVRDGQLRAADYFQTATWPSMTYRSTSLATRGSDFLLRGELTLLGRTREVPLDLTVNGFRADPYGRTRARFTATGEISRKDFGLTVEFPMDGGGMVIGDAIAITLLIQAVLPPAE